MTNRYSNPRPGFYTPDGVKTLPGIREAIERHDWQEATTSRAISPLVAVEKGCAGTVRWDNSNRLPSLR